MTKLMILAGIFTAIAYQPAHAQLYDYASEQAYGRRVEHGAAYRQDGGVQEKTRETSIIYSVWIS